MSFSRGRLAAGVGGPRRRRVIARRRQLCSIICDEKTLFCYKTPARNDGIHSVCLDIVYNVFLSGTRATRMRYSDYKYTEL